MGMYEYLWRRFPRCGASAHTACWFLCACVCMPVCIISIIFHSILCAFAAGFCVFISHTFYTCIFVSKWRRCNSWSVCVHVCVCVFWGGTVPQIPRPLSWVSFLLSAETCWCTVWGKTRWKKANQYFMRAKTSRRTHFIFSLPEHCLYMDYFWRAEGCSWYGTQYVWGTKYACLIDEAVYKSVDILVRHRSLSKSLSVSVLCCNHVVFWQ